MSAITICNGVFLHTPHFLLLECFVRQVQVFTSFIAGLKRASQSWSCWSLVELLGLFDGRRAGVQKVAAELSAHSHAPRLWRQGWGGRGAPSQPARGCRHISCDTAHCGTAAGARLPLPQSARWGANAHPGWSENGECATGTPHFSFMGAESCSPPTACASSTDGSICIYLGSTDCFNFYLL